MTKEQIRKAGIVLSNPRNQKAGVQALQDTTYAIGGKWRLLIINSICTGNRRFRDIQRSIPGLTTRMVSPGIERHVSKSAYQADGAGRCHHGG